MKINENQKVTLTLGQLKKLVRESEQSANAETFENWVAQSPRRKNYAKRAASGDKTAEGILQKMAPDKEGFAKWLNSIRGNGTNKANAINENQKVTLTLRQLKRLVREGAEWKSRWYAIDGHPDGGEAEDYFDGYCDACYEPFDNENDLSTLYGWYTYHKPSDEWNNVDSMTSKMDEDTYEEFLSDLEKDDDDYCKDCAIDILEEIAKKHVK